MKASRIKQSKVRLTEQQEERLSKLYSILDMINPVQTSSQDTQNYDDEKTVVVAISENTNIYNVPA